MRLNTRRVLKNYQFANLAAGTVIVPVPIYDLSHALSMTAILSVTKADTDVGDILDVKVQESRDQVTWNTRMRFPAITGDLSPTATAPEVRELNLMAEYIRLATTEESYSTTGSVGVAELAAGSVRNGPMLPPYRGTDVGAPGGGSGWLPSYRVVLITTDAGAQNAAFSGTLDLSVTSYS